MEEAQNDLLESRARYVLRDQVTESVVMTNPVLQAVHGGTNASPIEKYVLLSFCNVQITFVFTRAHIA